MANAVLAVQVIETRSVGEQALQLIEARNG
jgi:hypothetical protein